MSNAIEIHNLCKTYPGFSLKSIIETLKNLIKIVILLTIDYMSIREMFLESSNYLYTDLSAAVAHLVEF